MIKLTGARSGKDLWLAPQHVTAVQPGTIPLYGDLSQKVGEKLCTWIVTMNDREAWEVAEAPAEVVELVERALA